MKKEISRKGKLKTALRKAENGIKAKILSLSAFVAAFVFWVFNLFAAQNVLAGNLQSSQFFTGTKKLLEDLSKAILVLAPIITVIVVMYCFIRKAAADEMDHKKWQTRINTAIICGIGAVTAAALISMLAAYYGASGF